MNVHIYLTCVVSIAVTPAPIAPANPFTHLPPVEAFMDAGKYNFLYIDLVITTYVSNMCII